MRSASLQLAIGVAMMTATTATRAHTQSAIVSTGFTRRDPRAAGS